MQHRADENDGTDWVSVYTVPLGKISVMAKCSSECNVEMLPIEWSINVSSCRYLLRAWKNIPHVQYVFLLSVVDLLPTSIRFRSFPPWALAGG